MQQTGTVNDPRERERAFFWFLISNACIFFLIYLFNLNSILMIAKNAATTHDQIVSTIYLFAFCALIALLPLPLLLAVSRLFARWRPASRIVGAVIAVGAIFWIYLFFGIIISDIKTYQIIGVHIYSGFIMDALRNAGGMQNDIHLSTATILSIVGFFGALLIAEVFWYRFLLRRLPRAGERIGRFLRRTALLYLLLSLLSIGTIGLLLTHKTPYFLNNMGLEDVLPFYNAEFHYLYRSRSLAVDYPALSDPAPQLANKKNVMMVLVESYRADVFTDDLSPTIMSFIREQGGITSAHHFSSCHSTSCGTYSYLSGIHSYVMDYLNDRRQPFASLELLRRNGYAIYGASASMLKNYSKHLTPILKGFDQYREFLGPDPIANEYEMQRWIDELIHKRHPAGKPFFLFVFVNATHHNYHYPPEFETFTPVMAADYNHFLGSGRLAAHKDEIFNRYKNSARFVDHLFGRLTTIFRQDISAGTLAFSFAGDHGEEFWDQGSLGHATAKLIPPRIATPLLIYLPGVPAAQVPLSGHVDVFSTLLDYLQPPEEFALSRYLDGVSLLRPLPADRSVIVSGYGFPGRESKIALATTDGIVVLEKSDRIIGAQNTFTTVSVTDLSSRSLPAVPPSLLRAEERLDTELKKYFISPSGPNGQP